MKTTLPLTLLLTASLIAGCATIIHGTHQDLSINSNPSGARIYVNGEDKGVTPTTLTLKRGKDYQLVFKMDGYDDVTFNVEKKFKAGASIVGNIFSWGLIGIVVDVANGAAYALSPEQVQANLNKTGLSVNDLNVGKDELRIVFFTPDEMTN